MKESNRIVEFNTSTILKKIHPFKGLKIKKSSLL